MKNWMAIPLFCAFSTVAHGYCGGDGTAESPFAICSPADIVAIAEQPGAHYRLTRNLSLSSLRNFRPLPRFSGVFNGEGKTLSNLQIESGAREDAGLFSILAREGTIQNLKIRNFRIVGAASGGTLVGFNESGNIERIDSTGRVNALHAGGIVGYSSGGRLHRLKFNGQVVGEYEAGGVVGNLTFARLEQSESSGRVQSEGSAGGLVGRAVNGTVSNAFSNAQAEAMSVDAGAAALVADCSRCAIEYSLAVGRVSGSSADSETGGLVASQFQGRVADSFWDLQSTRQASSALGAGRNSRELKNPSAYPETWSREIWIFPRSNYPRLQLAR